MIFRFRIETALPENSLVEIRFPSTFGYTNNLATVTIPGGESANSDIEITLRNVSMPGNAGSYGPFGIYTRATANG
jgi:hypothetical protein